MRTTAESAKAGAAARRTAFGKVAPNLVKALGLASTTWKAPQRVPAYTYFYGDDRELNIVVCEGESPGNVDKALAYALAHVGNRTLSLILQEGLALPTQQRLVGLRTDVRLYTYQDCAATPMESKKLTLGGLKELEEVASIRGGVHNLGARENWVEGIIDWADGLAPSLVQANRSSYRAWHCLGRQLLKLNTTSKGIDVLAGVNYGKPTEVQPAPVKLSLNGPISDKESWRVKEAVLRGIISRQAGDDSEAHLEHQMQAALMARAEKLTGSMKVGLRREVPAKRPGGGTGFIDFVFVDTQGVLHLVETKIGADPMLVLQGLDYWLWAKVNRKLLEKELNVKRITDVQLDFVLGERDGTLVAPRTSVLRLDAPAQLQQLRSDIPWRLARVTGWLRKDPTVQQLQIGEIPDTEFMTGKIAKKSK